MKIFFNEKVATLKTAKSTDVSYCYQLSQRNMQEYRVKPEYKKYKEELVPSDVKMVMYKGRRFGYIEYQEKLDGWYLWDMQLSKILQGQGLGVKLLEYIVTDITKEGAQKLRLYVYAKNPVVSLYKRFGFKTVQKKSTKERLLMEKLIK
jgi:ribosomal protein S18 acetylase RimI-like enzyme